MRILLLCATLLSFIAFAADDSISLTDFETEADKVFEAPPHAVIVSENARSGKKALKITNDGKGYVGIVFDKPGQLKHFTERPMFCMDIFNPQDHAIGFSVRADDAKSTSYGTRYNDDGFTARPGWSTLRVNLTGLTRSSSNNFLERDPLNMSSLKLFNIFTGPHGGAPISLYLDNVRLEGTGLPTLDGLLAFDLGPGKAPVFPGFTEVNETTTYTAERGYGVVGVGRARNVGNPDALGGDYIQCQKFVVNCKGGAGKYVVHLGLDRFGEWATPQLIRTRTVALNGKQVLSVTMDGARFMKERYLRFEDDEDTPGMSLWERRVQPSTPIQTFEADVAADGKLEIQVSNGNESGEICFAVIYPKTKENEGKAWMEALEKRRRDLFENEVSLELPKPPEKPYTATAEEQAAGVAVFTRSSDADINCNSVPESGERNTSVVLSACKGERRHWQIGLLPLKAISGVKVTVSELKGPKGLTTPEISLRKVRNFAKRGGQSRTAHLLPFILQPFETLDLTPGFTRGIWVTVKTPEGASPGKYEGQISFSGNGLNVSVPIQITVLPFKLDAADDLTISCTGTTGGHWKGWYADLDERWWKTAEDVFRNQAEKGMNAVTGGPAMPIKAIKDGKAEIDFTQADRWMELANKYGLTHRGDSYQGFDVGFGFYKNFNKDGATQNEQHAKQKWGVSFAELLKIAYTTVEAHGKEKNWPPRSYYFLDEPRPEFGNVESAKALIELHNQAAPGVKFSGYYSPGGGRDPYFKIMPISIAHHSEKSIKDCVDNKCEAWTYSGGGSRYDIGRWLFVAHQKGLTGFLRNGYQYVNSNPYFDFSDTEGSWAQVYPSKNGILDTVGWERTADGVNDYRYLKTLKTRIDDARKAGKKTEADAAEAFMAETLKGITLDHERDAALTPEGYVLFRENLVKHLTELTK